MKYKVVGIQYGRDLVHYDPETGNHPDIWTFSGIDFEVDAENDEEAVQKSGLVRSEHRISCVCCWKSPEKRGRPTGPVLGYPIYVRPGTKPPTEDTFIYGAIIVPADTRVELLD